jgi:hypothetical protein
MATMASLTWRAIREASESRACGGTRRARVTAVTSTKPASSPTRNIATGMVKGRSKSGGRLVHSGVARNIPTNQHWESRKARGTLVGSFTDAPVGRIPSAAELPNQSDPKPILKCQDGRAHGLVRVVTHWTFARSWVGSSPHTEQIRSLTRRTVKELPPLRRARATMALRSPDASMVPLPKEVACTPTLLAKNSSVTTTATC